MAILVALAKAPTDKARIWDAVVADTVAAVVIKKSSLYRLVKELEIQGYIKDKGAFELTDKGWRTLRNELARIENQRRLLIQRLHI